MISKKGYLGGPTKALLVFVLWMTDVNKDWLWLGATCWSDLFSEARSIEESALGGC